MEVHILRRIIFYILMVFGIMTKVMAAAAVALLIIFAVYLSGIVRTFYTAPDISYREDMLSEESKEDNININNATVMLVDAINGDNGDGDSISGLFDVSDYDAVHEKAEQFMHEFALHSKKITKIYVSPYGYIAADGWTRGKRDDIRYEEVDCVFITDSDMYGVCIDFTVDADDSSTITFNTIKIISGRTEAGINRDGDEEYRFDDNSKFEYLDYYDSDYTGDYRLIWGMILPWNSSAVRIDPNRIRSADWEGVNIDVFKETCGEPAASFIMDYGYHMLFYNTDTDGEYLAVKYEYEDTDTIKKNCISKITVTDSIGTGYDSLREITLNNNGGGNNGGFYIDNKTPIIQSVRHLDVNEEFRGLTKPRKNSPVSKAAG